MWNPSAQTQPELLSTESRRLMSTVPSLKNGTFNFVTFLLGWGHDGTIVILPQRKFMFIPTPGNKS